MSACDYMKNSKSCDVLLTFDVDAESVWMSYGLTTPGPISRGTYGAKVGLPRVLGMLQKRQIPATFFVPGETARRHPDEIRNILTDGHELGHHGDVHEQPGGLSEEQERLMLDKGIEALMKVGSERPKGYRSPSWDLSENTLRLLEEYDFSWDSSLMSDDFKLYSVGSSENQSLVEIPVSWEMDDSPYFTFNPPPFYAAGLADPEKVLNIWKSEFDGAYENNGTFILTMHPQIIGRWHRMKMLECLLDYISSHDNVSYLRGSDAVNKFKANGI